MKRIALLRGINVGGKNAVPMRELATVFAAAGCENVQTYIQSGNVVFEAAPSVLPGLSERLTEAIATRFGCRVPLVLRTADEMNSVLRNNPLLTGQDGSATPEDTLHVYFLRDLPTAEQIAGLDPARSSPDDFQVQGCEVYLQLPNGMGRTRLTNAYFDAKLRTVSTARNWRTVRRLTELTGS